MKRKILLLLLIISSTLWLNGCIYSNQKLYIEYESQPAYGYTPQIIYNVKIVPTKVVKNKAYWDKDNIVLNVKYGWTPILYIYDENNISDDNDFENYELVTFATYIVYGSYLDYDAYDSWENLFYDLKDYRDPIDGVLVEEIPKDVFLSEDYEVFFGRQYLFKKDEPAIFNENNKAKPFKIDSSIIKALQDNNYTSFKFICAPVYQNTITGEYRLDFKRKFNGFKIDVEFIDDQYVTLKLIEQKD